MKGIRILPPTQASTFKKEVRSLKKAEKNGIPIQAVVTKMAEKDKNSNKLEAMKDAITKIQYVISVTEHNTPIADAVDALTKEKPKSSPNGSPAPSNNPLIA